MPEYKTPGVYVDEKSTLPPSVTGVSTAVPAFIGVPAQLPPNQLNALNKALSSGTGPVNPVLKISSLLDYTENYGKYSPLSYDATKGALAGKQYNLYDQIRLFYANGGDECYIVPVVSDKSEENGTEFSSEEYLTGQKGQDYENAISALTKIDEITILVLPDVLSVIPEEAASVQNAAINHCGAMKDRFVILDVADTGKVESDIQKFRDSISSSHVMYAAAYYPFIKTSWKRDLDFDLIAPMVSEGLVKRFSKAAISEDGNEVSDADRKKYIESNLPEDEEYEKYSLKYAEVQDELATVAPSGAIAGIYASVDGSKGVWQAPANVGVMSVSSVNTYISDGDQAKMNVDSYGKSINAIRFFSGKGILVWGARTLDGSSQEWKYIPVRRLFNYIEESIQESTSWAVFQPNDANTWIKLKCQIDNFLSDLWKDGALAGVTPEEAFFVQVGRGTSMTETDILNGYLKINIGIAAVRPAEFIVLTFTHKVQE